MRALAVIIGALIAIRPGVGKCEPQPEPACTDIHRMDAGKPAPCSGALLPRETYLDCLACADERANPCVEEKSEAANLRALLKSEREKHAATEAARQACIASQLPPEPPPQPESWYERPGFWLGLGIVAASVGLAFATEERPAWYIAGGFGAGVALAEAVR